MASPFGSFGGRGQSGGTISAPSTKRGRGGPASRGAQFQPRGSGTFRGRLNGNRGRGGNPSRGNGRGRGRGASTSYPTNSTGLSSQTQATDSGFTQLNQNKPVSNPFGGFNNNQGSSFSGFQKRSTPQASPFNHAGPSQNVGALAGSGLGNVPVENATILAQYHERYDQLKLDRAKQRQTAIRNGQMADPNKPTSLNKAITPVGTCESMCPEFESVERIVQKMVDKSEKYLHPSSNTVQNMETKMLKRFRRSAAGYDEQLPSDIRTPNALLQTTNYLIRHIVGGNEPLGIIHKFIWDRTRSVRNDFSVQQLTQENDVKIAVTCLERIARFHILSHHLLSSPANGEPFEHHQEREQLNNTMLSLMYYYDDNRGRIHFPNEDEFRAYHIILSIHDQRPDLEARVSRWPASLLSSSRVQVALDLYAAACNTWEPQGTLDASRKNAIAQGFYTRFFNIIDSPSVSYLMACVAEIYFSDVRQTALREIWQGYWRPPSKVKKERKEEWTMTDLTKALRFDDEEQTVEFCRNQNMPLATNADGIYLNWDDGTVDPKMLFSPSSGYAYSESYVEFKRAGRSLVAVILGMSVEDAAAMGMIDKTELISRNDTHVLPSIEEQDAMTDSPVSALPNPFQSTLPATNVSSLAASRPSDTPSDSVSPQPIQPTNPFGKPFTAANGPSLGAQPASATPSIAAPQPFNPFGKTFSTPNDSVFNSGRSSSTATPQPSNPFQPAPTTTPFTSTLSGQSAATDTAQSNPPPNSSGSMFSGFPATNGTAPSPPSSNPLFAAKPPGFSPAPTFSQSPFSFSKAAESSSAKTDETQPKPQSSSPFASAGLFKPAEPATSPPNLASVPPSSSPSLFPATTQAIASPAPTSLNSTTLSPTAKPFFCSNQPKDDSAQEKPTSEPVSLFQPAKPMFPSTGTNEPSTLDASASKPASPFSFTNPPKVDSPFSFASPAAAAEASTSKPASPFNFGNHAVTEATGAPKPSSPFSFANPAATSKPASPFNFASPAATEATVAAKPSSPFSFANPAATSEEPAPKPAPFSFASPGAAEPAASKTASLFNSAGPTPTQEPAQKQASPFSFASPAATTEEPASKSASSIFANPQKSSTPPFQFSSTAESKGSPPRTEQGSNPLFDFSSTSSKKEPAPDAGTSSQKTPFKSPSVAPAQSPLSSALGDSASQPAKSIFASPAPSESQSEKTVVPEPEAAVFSRTSVEKAPAETTNQSRESAHLNEAAEPTRLGTHKVTQSPSLKSSALESQSSNKRKSEDEPVVYKTPQEKEVPWDILLRRAAEKRAGYKAVEGEWEQTKQRAKQLQEDRIRKIASEQANSEKPLEVSDLVPTTRPQTAQNRASLFEASTRPLPKLPCLERREGSLKRKEPSDGDDDTVTEAQRRRQREADKDELLFSAARIAAEQLKNGPKIFERQSQPAHESLRYSYSPHRSFSASLSATPYSQSMSPPELSSSTHAYKVAYAPDTPLGLGRTLSRTEERIRRTGAHGLAYIPLDFSKSQRQTPDGKNQFSQSR